MAIDQTNAPSARQLRPFADDRAPRGAGPVLARWRSLPSFAPSRVFPSSARSRAWAGAALLLVVGTTPLQNAVANGDTRTLSFHHTHRGEDATFTFKKDGRYDPDVLAKMNYYLRDWRNDDQTKMDPHLFDIVWEVYRETGAKAPVQIVSSYRSPKTNAMLRSRSSGVAKFSQHMLGKAMDFYIPGVNLADLRAAGLRLQRGGVGFYPTSGSPFVHMDTGNVRHWPRMTHDQLARVFPDGKTVHVPSDGRPLARYDEALAEIRSRGANPGVAVASAEGGKGKSFFAALFGKKSEDDEEGASAGEAAGSPAPAAEAPVRTAAAPLPATRPAQSAAAAIVAAAATAAPLPLRRPGDAPQQVASLATPVSTPVSAPLPPVITRGTDARLAAATQGSATQTPAQALGYAAMGDISRDGVAREVGREPIPLAASPLARPRERPRTASGQHFDRLFQTASVASDPRLHTPELRVFSAFVAAPTQVVAHRFGDPASGLETGRFSGPAVVAVPVLAFSSAQVKLTQRM